MQYLLGIWTKTPEDYFFIENFILFLKKRNINSTLVFQKKNNLKKNKYIKNCKIHEIFSSKNKFINNILYLYFSIYFAILTIIKRPKKVYLFNSSSLLSILFFKPFYSGKIIYHNFDYNPYSNTISQKFLTFIEKKLSKYFEILIFSNNKRGQLFKSLSNARNLKIITIFNCLSKLHQKKKYLNYPKKKLLYRIGSIGPNHSLTNLISSMKYLDDNIRLLICGKVTNEAYYLKIKDLIKSNKLNKRVKIKTFVSNFYWKQKLSEAAIGVALYESERRNISHKYMCGASQKINAYLSENLPVLVPNEKQYVDFNKKYKCFININIKDPKEIAKSIKKIFLNKKKFTRLRGQAFKAFKNEFNFEKQVEKIIDYL